MGVAVHSHTNNDVPVAWSYIRDTFTVSIYTAEVVTSMVPSISKATIYAPEREGEREYYPFPTTQG